MPLTTVQSANYIPHLGTLPFWKFYLTPILFLLLQWRAQKLLQSQEALSWWFRLLVKKR